MEYTDKLKLKKPGGSDFYNIDDFNENADAIDAAIKDLDSKKANVGSAVTFGGDVSATKGDGGKVSLVEEAQKTANLTDKVGTAETNITNLQNDSKTKGEAIAKLNEDFVELADKTIDTFDVTFNNDVSAAQTVEGGVLVEHLGGATHQQTYNGYQLFDASKLPSKSVGGATVTNNGDGSFTISGSGALTEAFAMSYVLSAEELARFKVGTLYLKAEAATCPFMFLHLYGENSTLLASVHNSGINGKKESVELTSDIISNVRSAVIHLSGSGGQNIIAGTFKPMLYQDGDGTWEPFTGGDPSPSPSYPQRIDGVGDKGWFDGELLQGYYVSTGGAYALDVDHVCSKNKIPCSAGQSIEIVYEEEATMIRASFYNNGKALSYSDASNVSKATFTVPNNGATEFAITVKKTGITVNKAKAITVTINGKYAWIGKRTGANLLDLEKAGLSQVTVMDLDDYSVKMNINNQYFGEVTITDTSVLNTILSRKGSTLHFNSDGVNDGDMRSSIIVFGTFSNGKTYMEESGEHGSTYVAMTIPLTLESVSKIVLRFARKNTAYTNTTSVYSNIRLYFDGDGTFQPYNEQRIYIPLDAPLYEGDCITNKHGEYELGTEVVGKNMIDLTASTSQNKSYTLPITVTEGDYIFSFYNTDGSTNGIVNRNTYIARFEDESGNTIVNYVNEGKTVTSEQAKQIKRICCVFSSTNYTGSFANVYGQLESGKVATEYEPYKEVKVAKLVSGGNYGAYQTVRFYKEVVFDGTEDHWMLCDSNAVRTGNKYPSAKLKNEGVAIMHYWMCSHLTRDDWHITVYNAGDPRALEFRNIVTNFNLSEYSLDAWKTYLAEQYANGTPVKVVYELAEPIFENIDPSAVCELTACDGATNIEVVGLADGLTTINTMRFPRSEDGAVALAGAIGGFKGMYTSEAIEGHVANKSNPHNVTKEQLGLGNVPNVATNDQTPTYSDASTLSALTSGEKLSAAFGKIAKAVSDLISHLANKSNPHGVTKAQVGLGNVDNTSDKDKPISTAVQAALKTLTDRNNIKYKAFNFEFSLSAGDKKDFDISSYIPSNTAIIAITPYVNGNATLLRLTNCAYGTNKYAIAIKNEHTGLINGTCYVDIIYY